MAGLPSIRVPRASMGGRPGGWRLRGRPRSRMDDVPDDLGRMGVQSWRRKAQEKEEWSGVVMEAWVLQGLQHHGWVCMVEAESISHTISINWLILLTINYKNYGVDLIFLIFIWLSHEMLYSLDWIVCMINYLSMLPLDFLSQLKFTWDLL